MLMVFFSWLVIGVAAYIFGKAIVDRIYQQDLQTMGKLDIYIVAGIIFLNVYAQFFSLFYKVAGIACVILGIAGIGLVLLYGRQYKVEGKSLPISKKSVSDWLITYKWNIIVMILCLFVTLVWTTRQPWHYDTGLYHAQAIRWIEEYGVVPGLGNLQMRLAYNSAFMSLQALFSLEWLVGQSMHSLNGFFCFIGLTWALITIKGKGEGSWQTSDLLKVAMIIYIVTVRNHISSCGTDILSMLLLLYISIKWCESSEKETESIHPWCFCCLIAVYAVTVKLSAAVTVLLVIYPAYLLIKGKAYKRIIGYLLTGIAIVLPFLIRNVVISGYLIYPYSGLDLFDVDWKMDEAILEMDRQDITMFGRGITNPDEYDKTLGEWLPQWFGAKEWNEKAIIILGILASVDVCYKLFVYLRRRNFEKTVFMAVSIGGLLFWMISAPLMRYGETYFFVLIAVALGEWQYKNREKLLTVLSLILLIPSLGMYTAKIKDLTELESKYWIRQPDYIAWQASQYDIDGQYIWLPDDGDQVGYFAFPNTSSEKQLKTLALRGSSLKDGFRHTEKRELRKVE